MSLDIFIPTNVLLAGSVGVAILSTIAAGLTSYLNRRTTGEKSFHRDYLNLKMQSDLLAFSKELEDIKAREEPTEGERRALINDLQIRLKSEATSDFLARLRATDDQHQARLARLDSIRKQGGFKSEVQHPWIQ